MGEAKLMTYPRGWFVISFSDELKVGEIKNLRYFARDMVLFRTEDGQACLIDAYCSHLGAHLGHGGKVDGKSIRCPFHAWSFDGHGQCVSTPYADKMPKRTEIESWRVMERNGMIFMYHDLEHGEPEYQIPELPEYGDDEWLEWDHSILHIKTQPREIVENVADLAHFIPVHGTHPEVFENEFVDHMATQINKGMAYPRGGGKDPYSLTATYYGPAYQLTHMDGVLQSRLVNAHTPVDEHSLDLRFAVTLKILKDQETTAGFAKRYIENLRVGFLEDVAIWEHKMWRDRPALCDGDGPIGKLRKWYRQFYTPRQAD